MAKNLHYLLASGSFHCFFAWCGEFTSLKESNVVGGPCITLIQQCMNLCPPSVMFCTGHFHLSFHRDRKRTPVTQVDSLHAPTGKILEFWKPT